MNEVAQQPALRPPPGNRGLPDFNLGWARRDGGRDPFISYVLEDHGVNWSAEREDGMRLPCGIRTLAVLARPPLRS